MKEIPTHTICLFCGNKTRYRIFSPLIGHEFFCSFCYRNYIINSSQCPYCYSNFYTGSRLGPSAYYGHFCSNPNCPSYSVSNGDTKFERYISYNNEQILLVNSKLTYLLSHKLRINQTAKLIKIKANDLITEFAKQILSYQ